VRIFLFTVVGVVWFSLGMGLIIAQAWFVPVLEGLLCDESRLFILVQVELVISLALLIGTGGFAFRGLWIGVGAVGLVQGLFFILAPIGRREAILDWCVKRPFWEYRMAGFLLVGLATMLAYGIISL